MGGGLLRAARRAHGATPHGGPRCLDALHISRRPARRVGLNISSLGEGVEFSTSKCCLRSVQLFSSQLRRRHERRDGLPFRTANSLSPRGNFQFCSARASTTPYTRARRFFVPLSLPSPLSGRPPPVSALRLSLRRPGAPRRCQVATCDMASPGVTRRFCGNLLPAIPQVACTKSSL